MDAKLFDTSLPRGVADYLPGRAARLSELEQQVLRVAAAWGFQQVLPPALEFEDVLAIGMGEGLRARTFRFDDWQTGRLLAIPPDSTPQIARIVATRLKDQPLPHRISYAGRVLRHAELQSGRSREIMQAGVELIGLDSPEADAEMVAMAVEVMNAARLRDFKVDLGQVAFCQGVFEASGLVGESLHVIRQAVALKDSSTVELLLRQNPVSETSRRELLALPRLFGGCDVLEEADQIVHNQRSRLALQNIKDVVAILDLHGVRDCLTIDLGETRGLDYHTGLTFEGFVPGIGDALFSGGRYDDLTGRYGFDAPATGFTCNLFSLMQALELQGETPCEQRDLLVFNEADDRREALELSRELRQRGYAVARDIIKRDLEASLCYAAQSGIRAVLVIGSSVSEQRTYRLIQVPDRIEQNVSREQLWQQFPPRS
ncbi:ATP phosphoribosyltransferase regulatory subunit [Trichlorobacter lovleyi]|uniref:ATP phosphoribosyltransferase regulatory subunit n=1 Tax=Trichlorobacter lovleyi TaxID=313985 RepID=UPI0023EF6B50|nr:ATP phosphoribosyltransferase regulatory subunit [Trichlorobacter lovleyi]